METLSVIIQSPPELENKIRLYGLSQGQRVQVLLLENHLMNKIHLHTDVNIHWQIVKHYVGNVEGSRPVVFCCKFQKHKESVSCYVN